jgi:hypothetical protein
MNTSDFLRDTLTTSAFLNPGEDDGVTAIPYHWVPGATPLVLVLGENASGKSVFRRIVQGACKRNSLECMQLSMQGRNAEFGGLRSMVYGNEGSEATSVNSLKGVKKGIETCRGRETPHVIFWDEPDIGLSENSAAGAGLALARFAQAPGPQTVAAFVVCHSRAMVKQMLAGKPHYIHLGVPAEEAPKTLRAWLKKPVVLTEIDDVIAVSRERYRKVVHVMNRLEKQKV